MEGIKDPMDNVLDEFQRETIIVIKQALIDKKEKLGPANNSYTLGVIDGLQYAINLLDSCLEGIK